MGTADKRLVQLLLRRGQIDAAAAAKLEALANEERISVIDAAAATETVSDVDIARAIAAELKIPLVDFASSPPERGRSRANRRKDGPQSRLGPASAWTTGFSSW